MLSIGILRYQVNTFVNQGFEIFCAQAMILIPLFCSYYTQFIITIANDANIITSLSNLIISIMVTMIVNKLFKDG